MSERKKLVVAVGELSMIVQRMYSRYQDDVSQGRAERMQELFEQAQLLAQPIIDRYPFEYGRAAVPTDRFDSACKIGTVPKVVRVHGRDQIQVGKWVRIQECAGDRWHAVLVTKVNDDGYWFADR